MLISKTVLSSCCCFWCYRLFKWTENNFSFSPFQFTECITDLDSRLEIIIFKSILTTFEAKTITSCNQVKLAQILDMPCRWATVSFKLNCFFQLSLLLKKLSVIFLFVLKFKDCGNIKFQHFKTDLTIRNSPKNQCGPSHSKFASLVTKNRQLILLSVVSSSSVLIGVYFITEMKWTTAQLFLFCLQGSISPTFLEPKFFLHRYLLTLIMATSFDKTVLNLVLNT